MEILSNRDTSLNLGGGRAARILVADDNSNIQRMVTLALKDHGIDVIAVGNGEAAVRSMAQLKPDVILADVFMPVRSGYEVCEYVKQDSRYSHIPVVLLLGAFDPLDENEAKRVGADGVLKKPFVPPDPMIALVKALLEKSAPERLVPEPVAVAAGPEPFASPLQLIPRSTRPAAEALAPVDESPEIDYPPMGRDAFEDAAPVVAQPGILASAVIETDDQDVVTGHRDAALGEPSFWRPVESEGATQEAQEEERVNERAFEPVEPRPGYFDAPDENAAIPPQVAQEDASVQSASPELAAHTESETHVETETQSWAAPANDSESPASENAKPDWAASPNDWLPSAAAPAAASEPENSDASETDDGSDWPPAAREPMVELSSSSESGFAPSSAVWSEPEPAPAPAAIESIAAETAYAPETGQELPGVEEGLAEEPPVAESAALDVALDVAPQAPVEQAAPELADTQKIPPDVIAAATHAQDEAFSSESPAAEPVDAAAPASAPASGEPASAAATTDDLVNAVVARVLAKLQPQIAEMINEEILRPVVSALVRKEVQDK
jgi:CheY-like chemotaxis protein